MGDSNTVVSAFTLYRHLQQYCSHPSICTGCYVVTETLLSLSQATNFRFFQTQKTLQTTISSLMKMVESYPNRKKTLWEKEKLLVTSNFSFSRSVFKNLKLQTGKNQGSFGKGLMIAMKI